MDAFASFLQAFESRDDLKKYGGNALLLFALQLKFQIEDIHTVASNSLTDSNDDKKCDLVYVDSDKGYAVISQCYVSSDITKQEAKANKASDLNTAVSWLLTRQIQDLPDKLKSAAQELRTALEEKSIRSLQFWYTHNLPGSVNVRNELRTVENTAQAAISTYFKDSEVNEIVAVEVGQEVLGEWYKGLTIPILVSNEFEVEVPGGFSLKGQDSDWEAFVTSVPAQWLYKLFNNHGSDLFSANVRGYLGSRKVEQNINYGIKKTVQETPSHFWAYNNGLTALVNAFDYNESTKILRVKGISIVNGAQTTGAIGSIQVEPDLSAMVAARFVKCTNTETVRNIIRFNNSQNRVEAPDFRSNDSIQTRLVSEFESVPNAVYYGGRRGGAEDVIRRPAYLLPSDTVAQALLAFHRNPVVAYNEKSRIWLSDDLYATCFSERTTARHIVFVYSLVRAIEEFKLNLSYMEKQADLTEQQKVQLKFFRYRGATFLFTFAISRCLEIFLSKPVTDKFRVSFSQSTSPEVARSYWEPIIETAIAFCEKLIPGVEKGLKNLEIITQASNDFRSLLDAVKRVNAPILDNFRERVIID